MSIERVRRMIKKYLGEALALDGNADHKEPEKAWMGTASGRKFCPFDPDPETIDIRDIARGLAMTCRYGGQVKRYYSVAEHCFHVAMMLPDKWKLYGLLHDSAEAYIGDMIRPIKHQPNMHEFRRAEHLIEAAVAKKFGLVWTPEITAAVKEIDNRILINEIKELSAAPENYLSTPLLRNLKPLGRHLYCWTPERAEDCFLHHFENLTDTSVERL